MFAIRRIVPMPSKKKREDDEDSDRASVDEPARPVPLWSKMFFGTFPSWLILPLKAIIVIAFLLSVMIPVYIDFLRVAKAENEALIWPTGANTSAFDDLDQFNIELDLVGITPDAREVAFLFDLSPGGIYEHDSEPGMLDIDGDMSLVVSLGHQALEFDSGNVISDQNVVIISEDTVPLYCYPFDEYKIEMVMRAVLINESDYTDRIIAAINGQPDNTYRETIPVNMSLTYLEGHQGWLTKTTFEPLYDNNGLLVPGCTVMMTMRRSSSVRFFSMFVILLMWFISLTLFVIALNYTFSSSNEVAYDVPALMVGFLFAVPFIRQVQPDVPDIGIIVDIMGFFFNMILIALSTVMVMGALSSRHYRNTKAKIMRQEKRFEAQKLSAMGENHPTSNQPITASAPSIGLDPEAHPIAKDQNQGWAPV